MGFHFGDAARSASFGGMGHMDDMDDVEDLGAAARVNEVAHAVATCPVGDKGSSAAHMAVVFKAADNFDLSSSARRTGIGVAGSRLPVAVFNSHSDSSLAPFHQNHLHLLGL